MQGILNDIRVGLRALRKRPGFTLVAVLTVALGIGASTAIFSVVNAVLLQPFPYDDPDRLVMLWEKYPGVDKEPSSLPNFVDWRQRSRSFESMAAINNWRPVYSSDDDPERLVGRQVSADFFRMLKATPMLGRLFLPDEDAPGRGNVVVLSHGFWQRRFGGRADVVNTPIRLSGVEYTIVGVLPAGFTYPLLDVGDVPEIYTPLDMEVVPEARRADFLMVIGRIRPRYTVAGAGEEMKGIAAALAKEYPEANEGWTLHLSTLQEELAGTVRTGLLAMLGAVGFLLLIACSNVANLLLSRAAARKKEIAIRNALGAGTLRLIRQLLVESLLVSLLGGIAGLLLALWGIDLLKAVGSTIIPRIDQVGIDLSVLGFTLLVSILAGALFGIIPAIYATRVDVQRTLKEEERGWSRRSHRSQGALVAGEVALAILLLVGAGLMVRSVVQMQGVDPGFDPRGRLTVAFGLPRARYPDHAARRRFYDRLLQESRALPGVADVGLVSNLPLTNDVNQLNFSIEGRPQKSTTIQDAVVISANSGYFRAVGIPLLAGRDISDRDTGTFSVAVISQSMANAYWPGESPIGRRISFNGDNWIEVVGVVGDIHQFTLTSSGDVQVYVPFGMVRESAVRLVLRSNLAPQALVPAVRAMARAIDRDQALYDIRTMDDLVSGSIARPQFTMLIIATIAVVALLLAGIGVYGVISYAVTQRTREIGIRVALGATPGDLIAMVVRQGLGPVAAGVLIGIGGAIALTRLIESLLFGVSPTDPLTYAGVAAGLILVAIMASYLPARRAVRIEPMEALRHD